MVLKRKQLRRQEKQLQKLLKQQASIQLRATKADAKPKVKPKVKHKMALFKPRGPKVNPLVMDTFNIKVAEKLAREKLAKKVFKQKLVWAVSFKKKDLLPKYGDAKEIEFHFNDEVLESTMLICRNNGWFTEDSWKEHKVPINFLFNKFFKSSREYSDVKRFYLRNFFDERRRNQIGVRNDDL